MIAYQNRPEVITILLVNKADGSPLTGVTPSDVTLYAAKEGGSSYLKTMDSSNFEQIDATNMPGMYRVSFDSGDLDTLGEFVAVIKEGSSVNGTIDQTNIRLKVQAQEKSPYISVGDVQLGGVVKATVRLTKSGDPVTGLPSSEVNVFAVKNGATQGSISFSNWTEVDSVNAPGFYYFDLTSGLTDTMGDLVVLVRPSSPADFDDVDLRYRIIDNTLNRVAGLTQDNYRILNPTIDSSGNMTSATMKTYPTKADTQNDTNPIATYTMTASYDAQGKMTDYEVVREGS